MQSKENQSMRRLNTNLHEWEVAETTYRKTKETTPQGPPDLPCTLLSVTISVNHIFKIKQKHRSQLLPPAFLKILLLSNLSKLPLHQHTYKEKSF
jgi:hypothetical protein